MGRRGEGEGEGERERVSERARERGNQAQRVVAGTGCVCSLPEGGGGVKHHDPAQPLRGTWGFGMFFMFCALGFVLWGVRAPCEATCMYICIFILIYMCVYIYMGIYIKMYIYIYI